MVILAGSLAALMPFAAVGPDGLLAEGLSAVPNKLASTVMNCVADPVIEDVVTAGDAVLAENVPEVMAIWMFCEAGGAFWCGFHRDGSNQASNRYVVGVGPFGGIVVQAGLKTSLFKYGRFSMPANSLPPKLINVGTLSESH